MPEVPKALKEMVEAYVEETKPEFSAQEMLQQGLSFWPIREDDKAVGFISLYIQDSDVMGKLALGDHLYVKPEFRGLDIRKHLYKFLQFLKEHGVEHLQVSATPLMARHYRTLGFKPIDYTFSETLEKWLSVAAERQ